MILYYLLFKKSFKSFALISNFSRYSLNLFNLRFIYQFLEFSTFIKIDFLFKKLNFLNFDYEFFQQKVRR